MSLKECPECGHIFNSKDKDGITELACSKCIRIAASGPPKEGLSDPATDDRTESPPKINISPASEAETHAFTFTGNSGEYFRIWIVNLFLTVITFGIYSAWAKVRTRKYFYSNTKLGENSFDYDAPPAAILRGRLIVGLIFLLFAISNHMKLMWLYGILVGAFFILLPFLIYKSLRFNMHHTLFRNIRFRFLGTLKESYRVNLWYLFLVPVTAGIIIPYIGYLKQRYYFGNIAFGKGLSEYRGTPGPFYRYYFTVLLLMAGSVFISMISLQAITPVLRGMNSAGPADIQNMSIVLVYMLGIYALLFLMFTATKTFLYVRLTNYSLGNTDIGSVAISSSLSFRSLLLISVTNMLAVVFSVGLLYPWTKIRHARYCLNRISVKAGDGLNAFIAAEEPEKSAVGDAAVEFFDFEIGL
jgi:uncharacterized membrane protein YjgN (DUF898 family)